MRALLVEDDVKLAAALRRGLRAHAVVADVAITGDDALWMAEATPYDAVVLDVMLPGLDGFEVCRRLREAGVWVPIIMLTARDSVEDRVRGLDVGADDYLTKPFSLARAAGPGPGGGAARCGGAPGCDARSAACGSTPRPGRRGAARRSSISRRASSRCSKPLCAGRGRC